MGLPIDCPEKTGCYIQQYVDHDPGPGAQDFTCAGLSYDGHKGTDFGLPSLAAMAEGVPVIAAAPGIVRGVRDGMPDRAFTPEHADDLDGRDCGNGVAIRHEDGWETQYCHLREGSVKVVPGQPVQRGQRLGLVGMSGRTAFPHVHISLRDPDGATVDPFDPDGRITCGAPSSESLWIDPPPYVPGAILSAGITTRVPDYDEVKAGTAETPVRRDSPALILFGHAFGGRKGDAMELRIDGPSDTVISHSATLDRDQAQFFRAAGKRAPPGGWAAGKYSGTVTLRRGEETISRRDVTVTLR
ncbi:MAG: M23 family metallopeptidase [Paracoccaceae bacterium]